MLKRLADELGDAHKLSYNDAERAYQNGTLPKRRWQIYCLFWDWSAPRYSSWPQERSFLRRGPFFVMERINRFRRALNLPTY